MIPVTDQAEFNCAVDLFNRQDYFECHEVLEALWLKSSDASLRLLYQGILQIAVGLHHYQNNNSAGAVSLLNKGLSKLIRLQYQAHWLLLLIEHATQFQNDLEKSTTLPEPFIQIHPE